MMDKYKTSAGSLFFLLLCLLTPFPLIAGAPTDQIRASVDKVLAILNNPRFKSEARSTERRDQLRQAISSRFDFSEMARRSLGSHWRRRSPAEQEEFVRLFADLLERSYLDRIEAFNNESIIYHKENLDKNFAEVESRIVTHKGGEFAINYKSFLVNGEWKIYDVVIENISLVNNYRSQFNRIITNSSYEELVRKMKEKQIEMAGDKK